MKKLLGCFVIFVTLGFIYAPTVGAGELPVLPTDVIEARPNNTFVGIEGHFNCSDQQEAIDAINKLRKEACENHYINPVTMKPLKKSDYVPVEWSTELERRARIRACESTLAESHTRMFDLSFFYDNTDSYSDRMQKMEPYIGNTEIEDVDDSWECLAGPGYSLVSAVYNWECEKQAWIDQDKNVITGHYTTMISPYVRYVGMGAFELSDMGNIEFGGSCACGLFAGEDATVTHKEFLDDPGECIQTIEVRNSALSDPVLIYEDTLIYKKASRIHIGWEVTDKVGTVNGYMLGDISYISMSDSITVKENGILIPKKMGRNRAKVICTLPDGEVKGFTIWINCIPKKTKITSLTAGSKSVKVEWKKMKGITGYEIECIDYVHPWRQTKLVNVDGAEKTSYTFTGLDPSLDYSFSIRTYKKVNGETYYSEYPQKYKTCKPKS